MKTWRPGDVIIVDGVERTVSSVEYSDFVVVRHWSLWQRLQGHWSSMTIGIRLWMRDTRFRWKFRNDPFVKALRQLGKE